jgi:hypothetical protein
VNSGLNWAAQTSGTTQILTGLFNRQPDGNRLGPHRTLRKTVNGGTAWAGLTSGTTQTSTCMMVSATTGWYVANTGSSTRRPTVVRPTRRPRHAEQPAGHLGAKPTRAWTVGLAGVMRRTTDGVN